MSKISLVVIADPNEPFVGPLTRLPDGVDATITDDLERLKAAVPQADALLYAGFSPVLRQVVPLATRARWIHVLWTGVDGVLTPEMLNHPAVLTNGRGVFKETLADWVAAAMLFFAFDFRRVVRQQESGVWEPFIGNTLAGRTLGIVGFGSIGREVALRARAFRMRIAATRRNPELFQGESLVDQGYGPEGLRDLLAASDYVVAVTPLTAQTRGMISKVEFGAMKPGSVFMNIGRGPVVDEAALIEALESKKIRGAALDVFSTEPLPQSHPFWRMQNVLLSPHTADRVEGFLEPAYRCFFENLDRFLKGRPLTSIVDKQAGY